MNRLSWMPLILIALLARPTPAQPQQATNAMPEWAFDVVALLLAENGALEAIGTKADSRSLVPAAQRAIATGWCVAQLAAQGFPKDGYDGVWLTCTDAASFDGPWAPGVQSTLPKHGLAARLRNVSETEVLACIVAMLEGDMNTLRTGNAFEVYCVPRLKGGKALRRGKSMPKRGGRKKK